MKSVLRTAISVPRLISRSSRRDFSALLSTLEEFPNIPPLTPTIAKVRSTPITTLPNGLTVVTENTSSTSTISITFPNAGSKSESASEYGAALANKFLAFKSGSGLSSAVILRNLENNGAIPFATVGRMSATVGYTATPDSALHLLPLLGTTCSYEKWDVKNALATAKIEVNDAMGSVQTVLTESLYSAAYGPNSSWGRTFYSDSADAGSVKSFRDRVYVLNGAVLSATGISDHKAFVSAVHDAFSESVVGESTKKHSPAAFIGGEVRVHTPSSGYSHIALAFPVPSKSSSLMLNIIKHSITLSSHGCVSGFAAHGMVGAYGFAASSGAGATTDALCSVLSKPLDATVIERAKVLAKAEAMFALEGGSRTLSNVMAESVLETGSCSACSCDAYDAITPAEVSVLFASLAKNVPVAFAAVGDLSNVPYRGSILTRLA